MRELLEGVGFDPASIDGDEIKNQLRADTDEAVSSAAFGAPTLWLNCEISWGNDRLRFCRGCAESIFVKFDSLAFVR